MSNINLDKKDKQILEALTEDGRALIKDISKKTKIPRDSVNYRIKKMRSEGVIKAIVPICDTNKMKCPVYTWVCIELQQFDEVIEKKFQAYLKTQSNVIYIGRVTGTYHYIITIATPTIPELDIVMRDILSKFPNMIKTYNTSLMVDEIQYDTFHKLIGVHKT